MILIVAEHTNGALRKSAYEMVTASQKLADLGAPVAALIIGGDAAVAEEMTKLVDTVYTVSSGDLADFRAESYTTVVNQVAKDKGATVVIVSASKSGLSYTPRVAVRMDAALLEDVTGLSVEDGKVTATRLSYLSRVTETVQALAAPVVVSVKPNIFPSAEDSASGAVEALDIALGDNDLRVSVGEKSTASTGRVALEEASVVVTGGRGVGSPEGFAELVEPLADVIGAGVGASRAVVDAGWRPYAEQVGQTGKSVSPDAYIALALSGAVQHLSGMNRSKYIIAINKDPDAPIFRVADYGIVGDVNEIAPEITKAVKALS